ncbi:MAG: PH domain-containing protein [Litoreibacter sp.]|nr:PH domain-containing protein [Litoreibacter sp.]
MPHDDFHIEPVEGLPELPPEGEKILWQGKPNWWALAKESLSLKWIMGYFVLLGAWRSVMLAETRDLVTSIAGALPFLILGLIACSILVLIAIVQARTTVYTITNRRVAMRIGAALTVTLNLPFRWIGSVDLDLRPSGTGTIALDLIDEGTRLSYLTCWPHVRPWKMNPVQPALRCIGDAEHVANILGEAARTHVVRIQTKTPAPDAVPAE